MVFHKNYKMNYKGILYFNSKNGCSYSITFTIFHNGDNYTVLTDNQNELVWKIITDDFETIPNDIINSDIITTIPEIQTIIISTIPEKKTTILSSIPEITYYDNKEYCLSNNYYYHIDTKECVLNKCRDNYYQFNFECYKNNCPNNSTLISYDNKKCETNLNHCYIDKIFKTHCSNEKLSQYNLRYKDTKIYFKSCNESLYFFNIKTYLYKNICYDNYPEETIKDDANSRCICKYYKINLDEEKTNYECLMQNETYKDKNKYPIITTKE